MPPQHRPHQPVCVASLTSVMKYRPSPVSRSEARMRKRREVPGAAFRTEKMVHKHFFVKGLSPFTTGLHVPLLSGEGFEPLMRILKLETERKSRRGWCVEE